MTDNRTSGRRFALAWSRADWGCAGSGSSRVLLLVLDLYVVDAAIRFLRQSLPLAERDLPLFVDHPINGSAAGGKREHCLSLRHEKDGCIAHGNQ
jgi:hypothetical protein